MKSSLYFRTHLTAPWGIQVPAQPSVARFHVVLNGSCSLQVTGSPIVDLERGDLVVVPRGAEHCLLSTRDAAPRLLSQVLDETAYDGTEDLRYGGGGKLTTLVCGHFGFDDPVSHPVIEALPSVVHVRASQGHDFQWLDGATRSLGGETSERPPGWEVVVSRVSEILFVQVLRLQLFKQKDAGAAAAFADDRLSLALRAIHAEPEKSWDLETLAKISGLSRTGFAVRFSEHLGIPPMAYVTQWRLQKARLALLDTDAIVASIAAQHGYQSEAAFSRAFQKLYGKPPATYRREHSGRGASSS